MRARRLAQWVRWLLCDLAIPLLRCHFYVTESEAYKNLVFYYRRVRLPSVLWSALLVCGACTAQRACMRAVAGAMLLEAGVGASGLRPVNKKP